MKCYSWGEAKFLEQQGRVKGFETSPNQILVKGIYADPWDQDLYEEHVVPMPYSSLKC